MMIDNKKKANFLFSELKRRKLLRTLTRGLSFNDELNLFYYSATLTNFTRLSDGKMPKTGIESAGSSFSSQYEAILKCLGESIERLCLYCYKEKSIIYSRYKYLKQEALDPSNYKNKSSISNKVFGWVKGYNLTTNISNLIPAQLVYLNFLRLKKEFPLSTIISTGAAGGFDHESALARGIYEVIERDAFMTVYLNKIQSPLIDISKIKYGLLHLIPAKFRRYNLELYIFNTTNDLDIPCFMTIILDKTRSGPAIAVGLKSNLNYLDAIIGSICEAMLVRLFIRTEMVRIIEMSSKSKSNYKINNLLKKGLYWSKLEMAKKLDFLLNQSPVPLKQDLIRKSKKNELSSLIKRVDKKGFHVYYVDISIPIFKQVGYFVYKVLIPKLQPLYIDESKREIRTERLKEVSMYFKQKRFTLNNIPHPFL